MRILKPYATDIERFKDTDSADTANTANSADATAAIDSAIMAVTSLTTNGAKSESEEAISEEVVPEEVVPEEIIPEEVVSKEIVPEEEVAPEQSSMLFWYIILGLVAVFVLFLVSFIAFSEGSERIKKSGNIEISESESD